MKIVKKSINFIMNALETVVFSFSIFIIVYLFIGFPTNVQGASMEPNFHTGDRVITSRVAYRFKNMERGDVVVVKSPRNPDIDLIKRIVGLPQDKIMVANGKVYINGQLLQENYINVDTNTWEGGFTKEGIEYTIPENYIFIMGDNRPRSSDSREFGPVPLTSVVGQVIYQYYPNKSPGLM